MNTKMDELDAALTKIKELGEEKPRFKEEALEAVLLLDLLREVLGYAKPASRRQRPCAERQKPIAGDDGREVPDIILLKLAAPPGEESKNVFVEVKRYGAFSDGTARKEALRQAGKYSITQNHDYGIVTDGVRWTYFVITDSTIPSERKVKLKVVKRVAEVNLEKNAASLKLGRMLLARSRGSHLLALFSVLARLHETMTPDELADIKDLRTINERIEEAWDNGDDEPIPAKEMPLLRLLYHKNNLPPAHFCKEIVPLS